MKSFTKFLYLLAVLIGSFGYWGTETKSGRSAFDEMAGMIPFFALVLAFLILLIAVILTVVIYFRTRKNKIG